MIPYLLILTLAALPQIDVSLAPDQPVPHVYMEDPLILELVADADATVGVRLSVRPVNGAGSTEPEAVDLGSAGLRARGVHWRPIEGVATKRGHYAATVRLRSGDAEREEELVFCRIDRPNESLMLPVGVRHADTTGEELRAMAAVGVRRITVPADDPDAAARIEAALAEGFRVSVYFPPGDASEAATLATTLAAAHVGELACWEIDGRLGADGLRQVASAVRNAGGLAPVAVIVRSPDELLDLFSANGGRHANVVIVEHDAPDEAVLQDYRTVTEASGYEREPLHVRGRGVQAGDDEGARLIQQLIRNAANEVVQTEIGPSLVYRDGAFGSGYVMLAAYARRLDRAVYIGELSVGPGGRAHVFRIDDAWCVVFWGRDGGASITVDTGDATDVALSDVYNNPLSPPASNDGSVRLEAAPTPAYLFGRGGSVLGDAARRAAKEAAETFLENREVTEDLPSDLAGIVSKIARNDGARLDRPEFFQLVRAFPYIERQWHAGRLPQASAVSAMAGLARLTRLLCVVEQESGEKFIEPLQDTLGRCSQFESLYLTQSRATNGQKARGDWLLSEVDRLVAEAQALDRIGRGIEANAVATMAEWRARSLEFAAEAEPLERIDAPPAIPVAPEDGAADAAEGASEEDASVAEEGVEEDAADVPEPPLDGPSEQDAASAAAAQETEADAEETSEDGAKRLELTIKRGDNPWAISQRYNVSLDDLREWNNWSANQVLHIGDKYVVFTDEAP